MTNKADNCTKNKINMRYIILVTYLIVACVNGYTQEKKDSKVIIKIADTTGVLNKISLVLYERGYSILQKDEQLKFIATDEKTFKAANGSFKYRFFVKENT